MTLAELLGRGISVGGTLDPVRAYLPRKYWRRARDFFSYTVDVNTLGADAADAQSVIQINNESDFLCLATSYIQATTAAGTTEQTYAPVTVQIDDTASGANWFGARQHLQNVFGRQGLNGTGLFVLPFPRFVAGGSSITISLSNLESTARRLWLSFHGVKVYRQINQ